MAALPHPTPPHPPSHTYILPFRLPTLQNKVIFNYFPYPWFVSTIHVVVGSLYCIVTYLLGAKKASFERVRAAAVSGAAVQGRQAGRCTLDAVSRRDCFRQLLAAELRLAAPTTSAPPCCASCIG